MRAVRQGDCEIGFVEGPTGDSRGLQDLVVAQDELRAIVAADHPWARRRAVSAAALRGDRFLARERGSGTRAVATATLAAAGVILEPSLEVSSAEGLRRALLDGGFALLSERTVAAELATGALVAIPVAGVELRRALRAIRRTRPALRDPARAFWQWLARSVAQGLSPPEISE